MANFNIYSMEQAELIEYAYAHCSNCSSCPLNTPEGWRCSHLHEQASRYIAAHKEGSDNA